MGNPSPSLSVTVAPLPTLITIHRQSTLYTAVPVELEAALPFLSSEVLLLSLLRVSEKSPVTERSDVAAASTARRPVPIPPVESMAAACLIQWPASKRNT